MPAQPNILFITTDTLRCDGLGCYGNRQIATPHIDSLARAGTLFEHAYSVCPLCMPARNSWLTGLYAHQHRLIGNRHGPLREELWHKTFPSLLQKAGYHTALIGKHHFWDFWQQHRDYRDIQDDLLSMGFDDAVQVADALEGCHNEDHYTAWLREQGLYDAYKAEYEAGGGNPIRSVPPEATNDGFIAARSAAWLRKYDGPQPFMLWVSFVGPHPPYRAPGDYGERHQPDQMPAPRFVDDPAYVKRIQRARAQYYGMIEHLDDGVGRLLGILEEQGRADDTVVIFTSDHGDMFGDRYLTDKRHLWEPSVRVPLLIRGPGFQAGWRARVLSESVDLPVTMAAIGREGKPRELPRRPGVDLRRLSDSYEDCRRTMVFSAMGSALMLRTAAWKLIHDPEQGGPRYLYNLADDPGEQHNLAHRPAYAAVRAELTAQLLDHFVRSTTYTWVEEQQRVQQVLV